LIRPENYFTNLIDPIIPEPTFIKERKPWRFEDSVFAKYVPDNESILN
jgi:hypothetical protein